MKHIVKHNHVEAIARLQERITKGCPNCGSFNASVDFNGDGEVRCDSCERKRSRFEEAIGAVDFRLLCKQKQVLVEMTASPAITDKERLTLSGIIHLIDGIQDSAAKDLGIEVVYGAKT